MIQKKYAHQALLSGNLALTDEHGGGGQLNLAGVGPSRYVQGALRPSVGASAWGGYGGPSYGPGHYEFDAWRVTGTGMPDEYQMAFGLKVHTDGSVHPASLPGATTFKTKEEAASVGEAWLAAGGPGLALEHPDATKTRHRVARSAAIYTKLARMLSQLVEGDLLKLAEAASRTMERREEAVTKEALKAEAKRTRAAEKVRLAAEKARVKADKLAAKALKDAEKAAKLAARAAKLPPLQGAGVSREAHPHP